MIELVQNINTDQFVILFLMGLMLACGSIVFLLDKFIPRKKKHL